MLKGSKLVLAAVLLALFLTANMIPQAQHQKTIPFVGQLQSIPSALIVNAADEVEQHDALPSLNVVFQKQDLVFDTIPAPIVPMAKVQAAQTQPSAISSARPQTVPTLHLSHVLAVVRMDTFRSERLNIIDKLSQHFRFLEISSSTHTGRAVHCAERAEVYHCFAAILRKYENNREIQGALWIHLDNWINPQQFNALELDASRIFHTSFGMGESIPMMVRCFDADDKSQWWKNEKYVWHHCKVREWYGFTDDGAPNPSFPDQTMVPGVRHVTRQVCRGPPLFNCSANRVCAGHADLYYIPRPFIKQFIQLSDAFHSKHVFHEFVVATIISILHEHHESPPHVVQCWGGAAGNSAKLAQLLQQPCGHKIELTVLADAYAEMLGEQTQPQQGRPTTTVRQTTYFQPVNTIAIIDASSKHISKAHPTLVDIPKMMQQHFHKVYVLVPSEVDTSRYDNALSCDTPSGSYSCVAKILASKWASAGSRSEAIAGAIFFQIDHWVNPIKMQRL